MTAVLGPFGRMVWQLYLVILTLQFVPADTTEVREVAQQTMQVYGALQVALQGVQYYTAYRGALVVHTISEDVMERTHAVGLSLEDNICWVIEKISIISVALFFCYAIYKVYKWSRGAVRSEQQARRYKSDWPTWYAPSELGANKMKASGVLKSSVDTSAGQSGAARPHEGSGAAPAGHTAISEGGVKLTLSKRTERTASSWKERLLATRLRMQELEKVQDEVDKVEDQALVPASVSYASWAGPMMRIFRSQLGRVFRTKDENTRRALAMTRTTEEALPVTDAEMQHQQMKEAARSVLKLPDVPPILPLTRDQILPFTLLMLSMLEPNDDLYVIAYVFDHYKLVAAMIQAMKRGARISIMVDHKMAYFSNSAGQGEALSLLLACKADVSTYQPRKGGRNASVHGKVMVRKNVCVMLGSANFTYNSIEHCVESCVYTRAKNVVVDNTSLFTYYHASAAQYDPTRAKLASPAAKIKQQAAFREANLTEELAGVVYAVRANLQATGAVDDDAEDPVDEVEVKKVVQRGAKGQGGASRSHESRGAAPAEVGQLTDLAAFTRDRRKGSSKPNKINTLAVSKSSAVAKSADPTPKARERKPNWMTKAVASNALASAATSSGTHMEFKSEPFGV